MYFVPLLTWFLLELGIGAWSPKNYNDDRGYVKKFQDRFIRLDTIPACEKRTNGQTDTARQQRPRYAERRVRKRRFQKLF